MAAATPLGRRATQSPLRSDGSKHYWHDAFRDIFTRSQNVYTQPSRPTAIDAAPYFRFDGSFTHLMRSYFICRFSAKQRTPRHHAAKPPRCCLHGLALRLRDDYSFSTERFLRFRHFASRQFTLFQRMRLAMNAARPSSHFST